MYWRIPVLAKVAAGGAGAGLLALGALGASGTPVLAASTQPAAAQAPARHQHGDNRQDRRQVARAVFEAEADVLGIKPADLRQDLKNGQTVQQLVQAKGMNEQQFGQAVAKQAKPRLDRLVDNHQITAAQEQKVLDRLDSGRVPFWNGVHHKKAAPGAGQQ